MPSARRPRWTTRPTAAATWTAATSPTIAGGNYNFSLTGGVPYGTFSLPSWCGTAIRQTSAHPAAFTVAYAPPSLINNPGTPLLIADASVPTGLWANTARTVPLQ